MSAPVPCLVDSGQRRGPFFSIVSPVLNEEKEAVYEHLGTEVRTVADDKGLFKPDDLRRMGKR